MSRVRRPEGPTADRLEDLRTDVIDVPSPTGFSAGQAPADGEESGADHAGIGDLPPDRTAGSSADARSSAASGRIEPRDRPQITARALVLGVVVCLLALSLAYPLKEYFGERSQIAGLRQDAAAKSAAVAALTQRARQLSDPAYIKAEARKRLQYALPGDTVFVVVPKADAPASRQTAIRRATSGSGRPAGRPGTPWYDQLGNSITRANAAGQARAGG